MVLWLIIGWTYAFRYVTNADKTQEAKRTRPVTEGGGGDVHLPWRRHWPLKLKWIITIRCSSIDSSDSVYILPGQVYPGLHNSSFREWEVY